MCILRDQKKPLKRFDPSSGESNYVNHIGDAGNHNRTKYKDCSGKEVLILRSASIRMADLMIRKNVNLFAIQANIN
jgi:hypothetical protein